MARQELPWNNLTPATIWAALDDDTRRLAARSLYESGADDAVSRAEANGAIATALRFRRSAVGRMPVQKRIDYLVRAVRPDDRLAGRLLRSLHLTGRKQMLSDFLDALEIPQADGVIEGDGPLEPPSSSRLREAVDTIRRCFPAAEVELYLATLLAMDPDSWGDLARIARPSA